MGICKSCCRIIIGLPAARETELVNTADSKKKASTLQIDTAMSAPTIDVADTQVSGSGLALAGITVEQDQAYWEWHVECEGEESTELDDDCELKFGVATKKTQAFFKALIANDEGEDVPMDDDGTALMVSIPFLKSGDVIGVALQHSDLPMVQFLHNGEPLHHLAINRFRGTVYPSVWLRGCQATNVSIVFNEAEFKQSPPNHRFGPLLVTRGLI